ncbi:MAG: hypothetical protein K0U93_21915, partial [Gammaproteobacteria bacterium]|nr:hypothetical protein [Gammaproteobacteria bacterium]
DNIGRLWATLGFFGFLGHRVTSPTFAGLPESTNIHRFVLCDIKRPLDHARTSRRHCWILPDGLRGLCFAQTSKSHWAGKVPVTMTVGIENAWPGAGRKEPFLFLRFTGQRQIAQEPRVGPRSADWAENVEFRSWKKHPRQAAVG